MIDRPLRVRVVVAETSYPEPDLFETAPITMAPGETISWTYPEDGIGRELGQITLTPKPE